MSQGKKTPAYLKALVEKANQYIAATKDEEKGEREILTTFTTALLMEAGCYVGFNYAHWLDVGCSEWSALPEPRPSTTPYLGDQTRIRFYIR